MQEIPIRYSSTPTKFDLAPYGFIVKVLKDNGDYDYYIQLSKEDDASEWLSIPDYLDRHFRKYYNTESFTKLMLKLHENKTDALDKLFK